MFRTPESSYQTEARMRYRTYWPVTLSRNNNSGKAAQPSPQRGGDHMGFGARPDEHAGQCVPACLARHTVELRRNCWDATVFNASPNTEQEKSAETLHFSFAFIVRIKYNMKEQ